MSREIREELENLTDGYEETEESEMAEGAGEGEDLREDLDFEEPELPTADEELAARIAERRRRSRRSQRRRKRLMLLGIILIFAVLFTMCGRNIVRLKRENYELRRQHRALEEERDRLQEELKRVGDKDYIKDQARKQLRLLDPGEIMFIFDEDPAAEADDAG